ncbi:hypothetical protein [Kitasatospora sp. NPDC057198]|uniref:hypothetical protein n=1 Tax=Kitasatospora sp. NPDC057198 TaxID=3346046 RepID=UPI0036304EB9
MSNRERWIREDADMALRYFGPRGCEQCSGLRAALAELGAAGEGVGGRLEAEYVIALGHLERCHDSVPVAVGLSRQTAA